MVRRLGDRLIVPNEDTYLSKEQRERDKRSAEWRSKLEAYKKKIKEQKIGKDVEGMRGTINFLPNTGIHYWTFRWNHEPGRNGHSDAIGICSDMKENFGAGPGPLLGSSSDGGSSLGRTSRFHVYDSDNVDRNYNDDDVDFDKQYDLS